MAPGRRLQNAVQIAATSMRFKNESKTARQRSYESCLQSFEFSHKDSAACGVRNTFMKSKLLLWTINMYLVSIIIYTHLSYDGNEEGGNIGD